MNSAFLFVYGSLLKQANNIMSGYLSSKSKWHGEGVMAGHLFMVSYYPGALYEAEADSMVKGDIFKLDGGKDIFRVLDDYEDFHPENPSSSTFVRELVPVRCGEELLDCWVYLYARDSSRCIPIPSGDYLQFDMQQH